ncbi:MAG TPA: DNA methyltransferase [Polyangiaceae bacterium]|nr:DNA methyltransferase [Polyangiaceae bacterium]
MAAKKRPRGGKPAGPALKGAARRIFETTGEVPLPRPVQKQRRALTHVGGPTEVAGDPRLAEILRVALDVHPDETRTRADVHGFHTYPARMHPDTAYALVQDLCPEGGRVLDPFCGSGTVCAEARRAGRHAFGVDANPLATELAWLKARGITNDEGAVLVDAALGVREHADIRRKKKLGATQRYPDADVALFEPHVLLELDGLRDAIKLLPADDTRRLLWLVLSSLIGKVSRRPGDTTAQSAPRRLGAGYTAKLFQRRTEELITRMREYAASLPPGAPEAKIRTGDARDLGFARDATMDVIVTSPPYAGVYDYYDHHAARLRWLGLPASQFESTEVGSRRRLEALPFAQALGRYQQDFARVIAEMARVLTPTGCIAFQVADSTLSGRAVHADRLVEQMANANGLAIVARASQQRTNFHGASQRAFTDRPRAEHLLLLARQ